MHPLQRYMQTRYEYGGRGPDAYDCYGLVRAVRAEIFGLPWMPHYRFAGDDDKRAMTLAARHANRHLTPGPPEPGAIAECWRGELCTHVAVVVELDGRLAVLETDKGSGPRWDYLEDFEACHLRVIYYH
ncbi:hypothetical protein [Halomonas caseinilytica]|uniref:CHAP domain-containing protein n=1 Tax=Halomonas caseinilytica TaxID=438744 RepID=A0A1M7B3B7_9GAMM|nr:hypothetical protein [Halomonas caseinilytica]SHL49376.1 hypothetical protein SAMN05192556_1182 [Halomonas caseinilytica]